MGRRYNASKEQGRMTHESSPVYTRNLLHSLNLAYPPGDPDAVRYADRSSKGGHYRTIPGVGEFFWAKVVRIKDTPKPESCAKEPDPRTEFIKTHEFLEALTFYIEATKQSPKEIMAELHEAINESGELHVQEDRILTPELV